MDRIATSQYIENLTGFAFKAVKTTTLIDWYNPRHELLDKTTARCENRVATPTRNLDKLNFLTADKGCGRELFRRILRSKGVKKVIKYRRFCWRGVANNVLIDDTACHQRSNIESAFFALRRKCVEIVPLESSSVSSTNSS